MSRTRMTLAAAAAGALVLSAGAVASADPSKCDSKPAGQAVHTVESAVERVPVAGPIAGGVIHDGGVEDTACSIG